VEGRAKALSRTLVRSEQKNAKERISGKEKTYICFWAACRRSCSPKGNRGQGGSGPRLLLEVGDGLAQERRT